MNKLTSWKQLKVNQYLDVISLNPQDYKDTIDFRCDVISILYDLPIEEIERLSIDELFSLEDLPFLKTLPKTFNQEVGEFKLIDFKTITLGQFIDIEHYISDLQNTPLVLSILYRRSKLNEWNVLKFEPYEYDLHERKEFFNNCFMSECFGAVQSYIEFHDMIMASYKELFFINEVEDEDEMTPEVREEIEQEKKLLKFSWERLLYNLSNEDITKFKDVLNLPVIFVFNHLSMKKGGVI